MNWTTATAGAAAVITLAACTSNAPAPRRAADEATTSAPSPSTDTSTETPSASELIAVPDVTGLDPDEAAERLEAAGLTMEESTGAATSADDEGKVVSQGPPDGTEVEAGSSVKVIVGGDYEPPEMSIAQARSSFEATMMESDVRDNVITALEGDIGVESVDKYAVEDGGELLTLAVTSRWASDDRHEDDAWDIARNLIHFWSDDFWSMVPSGDWWPELSLTVNDKSWSCPGSTMRGLAQREVARAEWESACGR